MTKSPPENLPYILVVGAGFAGLTFAREFPAGLARIITGVSGEKSAGSA